MVYMNRSLVAFFLGSRAFRRALIPLVVAALFSWTALLLMMSTVMTAEQRVTSGFGLADGLTPVPAQILAGRPTPAFPQPASATAVVERITAVIDFAHVRNVAYVELPLPSWSMQGRLDLNSGRWPTAAGEIVVSPTAQARITDRPEARKGHWPLHVVGVATDVFKTDADVVYAAAGTWSMWQIPADEAKLLGARGQLDLLWRSADPAATAREFDSMIGESVAGSQERPWPSSTAEQARLRPEMSGGQFLLEYGFASLMILVFGAVTTGGLAGRVVVRVMYPLADLGLPARTLFTSLIFAVLSGSVVALGTAIAAVYLLVLIARPLLAASLTWPIRPWGWFTPEFCIGALVALATVLAVTLFSIRLRRNMRARRSLSKRAERFILFVSVGLLFGAVTSAVAGEKAYSTLAAIIGCTCAGCALLSYGLLRGLARMRPPPGVSLAAVRMLGGQLRTVGAYTAATTALLTVVVAALSVAAGLTANLSASMKVGGLPPGIVAFRLTSDGVAAPTALLNQFESAVGVAEPTRVMYGSFEDHGKPMAYWGFEDVRGVERVLGPLGDGQRRELAAGHGLAIVPAGAGRSADADVIVGPANLTWIHVYLQSARAITSRDPGPGSARLAVYAGLSPAQDRRAYDLAKSDADFGAFVWTTSLADPLPIPLALQLGTLAFGIIVALLSAAMLRSEASTYRPLLAAMNAVGLGEAWLRRVLLMAGLVTGSSAALLSLLALIMILLLANVLLDGSVLLEGVPWVAVAALLLGSIVGGCIGAFVAGRRLRLTERAA